MASCVSGFVRAQAVAKKDGEAEGGWGGTTLTRDQGPKEA